MIIREAHPFGRMVKSTSESEADNHSFVSLRVAVEHKALKIPYLLHNYCK